MSPGPVLTATRWRVEFCVRQCSGLPASEKVTGTLRISRSTLRSKLLERFPGSNISYGKACASVDVLSGGKGPPVRVTFQAQAPLASDIHFLELRLGPQSAQCKLFRRCF